MSYNKSSLLCDIFVVDVYLQSSKKEVWLLLNVVDT